MTSILFFCLVQPLTLIEPVYPPNTVTGGIVVASLHISSGTVEDLNILSGEEPFLSSTKAALIRWRFAKGNKEDSILAIVYYRQPNFYSVGSAEKHLNDESTEPSLPYPIIVFEPAYTADALGQGSVVLKLEISEKGGVSQVEILQELGSLTQSSMDAIKKWQFKPAKDEQGKDVPKTVYAVVVFRFPLVAPTPSNTR